MAMIFRCAECHELMYQCSLPCSGRCPKCGGDSIRALSPAAMAAYTERGADALCDACGEAIDPDTLCCTACGIGHMEPCPDCGRRGVHRKGCPVLTEGYRRGEQWAVDAVSAKEGR